MEELEAIRRGKLERMMQKTEGDGMETETDVNDKDFKQKVIERSKKIPVVVDFWAPWCGPCMTLGPLLEDLAKGYGGKFILAKLNVEQGPATAREYDIMSIPAVKLFKDGEVVDEFVGALPQSNVRVWLDKNLG